MPGQTVAFDDFINIPEFKVFDMERDAATSTGKATDSKTTKECKQECQIYTDKSHNNTSSDGKSRAKKKE